MHKRIFHYKRLLVSFNLFVLDRPPDEQFSRWTDDSDLEISRSKSRSRGGRTAHHTPELEAASLKICGYPDFQTHCCLLVLLGHHATSRTTHRRQRLRRRRLAMSRHLLLARQCQTCQPKATESTTRPPRTTTYHSICSRKNRDHCSLVLSDCFNQT